MWIKIDDGMATHRKYLKAGPLALALQVRAICFCSQNQTDGVIVPEAAQLLLVGLPVDVNWIQLMVENGLWDFNGTEYSVHGYLEWNVSKNDIEEHREKKRNAGRKGGKSRWNKEKMYIANTIAPAIAPASDVLIAEPWHAISTSISTSSLNSSESNSNKKKIVSKPEKRKTLEDFTLTDNIRAWARKEFSVEIPDDVVEEFKDHWRKEPDKKLRTDWTATFQSNVRKLVSWGVLKKTLPSQNTSPANGSYHKKVVL